MKFIISRTITMSLCLLIEENPILIVPFLLLAAVLGIITHFCCRWLLRLLPSNHWFRLWMEYNCYYL